MEKFDILIAEKQHEELKTILEEIATLLSVDKSQKVFDKLLLSNNSLTKSIISSENLKQKELVFLQEINKETIAKLSEISSTLAEVPTPKKWDFEITRNTAGYIERILATQIQ